MRADLQVEVPRLVIGRDRCRGPRGVVRCDELSRARSLGPSPLVSTVSATAVEPPGEIVISSVRPGHGGQARAARLGDHEVARFAREPGIGR